MVRKLIDIFSGLGYIAGSQIADLTGDWRWGVRFTPFLNAIFLVLMFLFLLDPPRGSELIALSHSILSTNIQIFNFPDKEIFTEVNEKKGMKTQLSVWMKVC